MAKVLGPEMVNVYNHVGCDALNISYRELVLGLDFLKKMEAQAKFPFISANIIDATSGKPIFRDYILLTRNGVKVGIFGLAGIKNLPPEFLPANPQIKIKDPYQTAREMVEKIKSQADLIILLSYLGIDEDRELAKQVRGINVILGGSSRLTMDHVEIINNTAIGHSGSRGRTIAKMSLSLADPPYVFSPGQRGEEKKKRLKEVESRIKEIQDNLAQNKKNMATQEIKIEEETLQRLVGEQRELTKATRVFMGSSSCEQEIINLDKSFSDDPKIAKEITELKKKVEPLLNAPSSPAASAPIRPLKGSNPPIMGPYR